jgi:hypothetical protein
MSERPAKMERIGQPWLKVIGTKWRDTSKKKPPNIIKNEEKNRYDERLCSLIARIESKTPIHIDSTEIKMGRPDTSD